MLHWYCKTTYNLG